MVLLPCRNILEWKDGNRRDKNEVWVQWFATCEKFVDVCIQIRINYLDPLQAFPSHSSLPPLLLQYHHC